MEGAELRDDGAECPIELLGHGLKTSMYALTATGQIVEFKPNDLKTAFIEFLFGGDVSWPMDAFPAQKAVEIEANGEIKTRMMVVGFKLDHVRKWIIKQCSDHGLFIRDDQERGPGVYRPEPGEGWADAKPGRIFTKDKSPTQLVIHAGDEIRINGEWRPAGRRYGEYVYPKTGPEPKPATKAASAEACDEIFKFFQRWDFEASSWGPRVDAKEVSSILLMGWCACGVFPGALEWRSHIFVTGPSGTGKSTLFKLMIGLLGGEKIVELISNPTAASVRQMLGNSARACFLDEVEHSSKSHRADDIIEYVRMGSTDGQGKVARGTPSGQAMTWVNRSQFCISAINPVPLREQDANRFTIIEVLPAKISVSEVREIERDIEDLTAKISKPFRARLISRFEDFEENRKRLRVPLLSVGLSRRLVQQYSTLFAGYWTACHDELIEDEDAERLAAMLDGSVSIIEIGSTPEDVLNILLAARFFTGEKGNQTRTVGQALSMIEGRVHAELAVIMQGLQNYGIKIVEPHADRYAELGRINLNMGRDESAKWVCIANKHSGLSKLFDGTDYGGGAWGRQLARHGSSYRMRNPVKYSGGLLSRSVAFPLEHFKGDAAWNEDFAREDDDGQSVKNDYAGSRPD